MSKYKFQQIEPQPARGTLREEMWDSPDWIAEEKYDGDRRIAQFCGKVVRFTGRRKSVHDGLFVEKTENVPHLSAAYTVVGKGIDGYPPKHKLTVPTAALEGTVLDGEMIFDVRGSAVMGLAQQAFKNKDTGAVNLANEIMRRDQGGASKFVTSIMGSLPEEAVRKQIERGWLRYVVFDILFLKGKDLRKLPLWSRQKHLSDVVSAWGNPFVSQADRATTDAMPKRRMYERIVAAGGEGVILKHRDHTYGDKTLWVKVKKQATADVVIMGFIPAKEMSVKKGDDKATLTKYAKAGLIGAIRCGQWYPQSGRTDVIKEVATVSGMTDDLRAEFTKHPKKYIGKVIEIEHNGREPTGRFRHPRLAHNTDPFRIDKAAKDCVYREDES